MERYPPHSRAYGQRAYGANLNNGRQAQNQPPSYVEQLREVYENTLAYEEVDQNPGRRSTRRGPHHGSRDDPSTTARRTLETDEGGRGGFVDPRPQGARGREPHHLNDIDDFDEEEIHPYEPLPRGGPPRRQNTRSGYMVESGPMALDVYGGPAPRDVHPSSRLQGSRTMVPGHQSSRDVPNPLVDGYSLNELEYKFDRHKRQFEDLIEREQKLPVDSLEYHHYDHVGVLKKLIRLDKKDLEIVDPDNERLYYFGASNPHHPPKVNRGHEGSGSRHGHRGFAPPGSRGDHGHHGPRRSNTLSGGY